MENVVLEIGTEEIPAQYMENALKNLNQLAQKYLEEARINYKEIIIYGTPRRLILLIFHIKEKQKDILAPKFKTSQLTIDILPQLFHKRIKSMQVPIATRWEEKSLRFIRRIR